MAATAERIFAQLAILEFLRASRSAKTTREIHSYLLDNTDWGKSQLGKRTGDHGKQNMEKWIRNMHKSSEFCEEIKWEPDPENRKQHLYSAKINPAKRKGKIMPIEEACFLGLAEKFLDVVLPTNIDDSMRERFVEAKAKLRRFGESRDLKKQSVNAYINRIDAVPRGQDLYRNKVPYTVIAELSKAILEGKCVKFKYKGRSRFQTYHPYGIVIREPKIYFLGVNEEEMKSKGSKNCKIFQFLCNRIESPVVTSQFNRVPKEFKTQTFIRNGRMAVGVRELEELANRRFTLKLRFYNGKDNLRLDLEEFPLTALKQTIEDEPGTSNFVLTAPGMRASHQLVDWILGRMARVEVLEPARLRKYVADRIEEMHKRYS